MTTTVIVQAHCAKDTEVHIVKTQPDTDTSLVVLQDGEENRQVVYDDINITVYEVPK